MSSPHPLALAALTALALVPGGVFAFGRSEPIVVLSAVCVLLVAASLYLMFEPRGRSQVTA